MAKVTVLHPGLYTSLQDMGRFGFSAWGIPASGAMDHISLLMANKTMGNPPEACCLEITQSGPTLHFSEDTVVLFSGAATPVLLNEGAVHLTNLQWLTIKKGDTLKIGYLKKGFRSYMAIMGGFQSELKFGSRSQSKGITPNEKVNKLDTISYHPLDHPYETPTSKVRPSFPWTNKTTIEVYAGPEFSLLSRGEQEFLSNNSFTISQYSNRMALQLEERLPNSAEQILTSPVFPGTIQLTPAGKLLILMREAQVTGGYPRILQVKEEEINLLAQMPIGTQFKLKIIKP